MKTPMKTPQQEALEKAIDKAIANGWDARDIGSPQAWKDLRPGEIVGLLNVLTGDGEDNDMTPNGYMMIIFDKDFARALWGERRDVVVSAEGWAKDAEGNTDGAFSEAWSYYEWEYHVMRMAVAHDPLIYLGENL